MDGKHTIGKKQTEVITRVSGPLVEASGMGEAQMFEVVQVGKEKLLGEIIALRRGTASIQVYEDTSGIEPGEPVFRTGSTMSVELGPGLLESIYDGIQRPLSAIAEKSESFFIARGIEANGISRDRKWEFKATAKKGTAVSGGDIIGEHEVLFATPGERIVLKHVASDRTLFARGALKAALWGQDKGPGHYDMLDVLGLG